MKYKKKKYAFLMLILTSFVLASCTWFGGDVLLGDYDLGLAIEPLNSLNYIRYLSNFRILPSLVEGILKESPAKSIKNLYSFPQISANIYNAFNGLDVFSNAPPATRSSRFYPVEQFSSAGVVSTNQSQYEAISAVLNANQGVLSITARLNEGLSKWSNGEPIKALDFVDFVHYVLDINSGSQRQINLLNENIAGARGIIEAQTSYLKKFKKPYQNPFGYPKLAFDAVNNSYYYDPYDVVNMWRSQNAGDEKEVAAIKAAALKVGVYSGQLYLDYDNSVIYEAIPFSPQFDFKQTTTTIMLHDKQNPARRKAVKIIKNPYLDPLQTFNLPTQNQQVSANASSQTYAQKFVFAQNEYGLRVAYEPTSPPNIITSLTAHLTSDILPVNRKFIESLPNGLNDFGINLKTFLTNGPFNLDQLNLGNQGMILLTKKDTYYAADRTISNKIKIFFNSDPNVNAAWFQDNYIALTRVPAVQQFAFWTNPSFRQYLHKSSGYGTIALAYNLDQETRPNTPLKDPLLRNAIYYAIDRSSYLRTVGWHSSFPVNTWTAFNVGATQFGDGLELSFNNQFTNSQNNKRFPLQNYTHFDHLAKSYRFENVDRKDQTYDLETARFYLDLYRKQHPNRSQITLEFIHNSTTEQINAAIALKDMLDKAFGSFIVLNIKGLPENVYEDFLVSGQFDIVYKNFDKFGRGANSYVKVFFSPDEIDSKNEKTTGFRLNPVGSWTYRDYFDYVSQTNSEARTIQRLELDPKIWKEVKQLAYKQPNETADEYLERTQRFLSGSFSPQEMQQGYNQIFVFEIITALEKIVRDAAIVVPLMEVDTYWEISRVGGVSSNYTLSLQYAYDVNKPPRAELPKYVEFN